MTRFVLLLSMLLPLAASAAEETWELPGAFTRDTTLAQLQQRFGAQNVVQTELDGPEGSTFPGVVIFGEDPARRVEIIPGDGDTGISSIRVRGETSKWHYANGVRPGMTLDALVAINGKPITFSGLGWDYGGSIQNWQGGKLEPVDGGAVFQGLSLVSADDAADGSYPLGDAEFRSDDKRYPAQGTALRVGEIMLSFIDAEAAQ